MLNIRPICKELQEIANDELHEDVSRLPQDIEAIKEWLSQQKYINARTDDQTIVTFLRGCKYSLERTKEKIESFYTMRTLLSEFFRNRDPFRPEIQEMLKCGACLPLPKAKDPTAPRIILVNLAAFDPLKTNKDDYLRVEFMIEDILMLEDDQFNICGIQVLVQFEGMKMSHIMSPSLMNKSVKYMEDCLPTRTKGMHLLNMPSFFETVYKLVMSFAKDKLKSRTHLHNLKNLEEIYKILPKETLPKEFGGDGPTLQELKDYWKEKVESYAEWFKEDDLYGTNENLRPGNPKTVQESFGIEGVDGSFRKLNVD